jgi:hypothetical protein
MFMRFILFPRPVSSHLANPLLFFFFSLLLLLLERADITSAWSTWVAVYTYVCVCDFAEVFAFVAASSAAGLREVARIHAVATTSYVELRKRAVVFTCAFSFC